MLIYEDLKTIFCSPYDVMNFVMELVRTSYYLRNKYVEYYGYRNYTFEIEYINGDELPLVVKYITIPVVLFYDFDDGVVVSISNPEGTTVHVAKAYGYKWVPPFIQKPIVYLPGSEIVIEPKPKKMLVIIMKPIDEE